MGSMARAVRQDHRLEKLIVAAFAELIAREQTGIRKSGKEIALLWAWLELLKKEH
jgi:hypothetical protein